MRDVKRIDKVMKLFPKYGTNCPITDSGRY